MPEARGRQYKVGLEAWLSTTGVCWKHAACCIGVTAAWDEASTIAAHQGVDLRTAKAEGQQSQALGGMLHMHLINGLGCQNSIGNLLPSARC
eukprot:1160155-Pelagomonas_calceolata.AAC.4